MLAAQSTACENAHRAHSHIFVAMSWHHHQVSHRSAAMQTPVDLRPDSPMHDASSSAGSTVCARCCHCHTGIRGARTFCKSCDAVHRD